MDPPRERAGPLPDAGGDTAARRAALTRFLAHLDAGAYFDAHEALEVVWRRRPDDRGMVLLQGLIQLAVSLEHHRRGNPHGARVLLERAWSRLHDVRPGELGLDWTDLPAAHAALRDAFAAWDRERGPRPEIVPPRLRPSAPGLHARSPSQ